MQVFISYSHDSDEHRKRVLGLSERLRADGIETILDRLLIAGPLAENRGRRHAASLFVYGVDQEGEARQLLEDDPYFQAGIYGEVRLWSFTPAAGRWIGGTIW